MTGHRNRHVASHKLNQDSSRSHSIFTIHVEGVGQSTLTHNLIQP